ncbi:MAG: DsrE/DsrF/DrsH-like family protein [Pirellulaceae bacterium]
MFFTFWATSAPERVGSSACSKTFVERAFGWMLPRSLDALVSPNWTWRHGAFHDATRDEEEEHRRPAATLETAAELGVVIQVCEMSMRLMGKQQNWS